MSLLRQETGHFLARVFPCKVPEAAALKIGGHDHDEDDSVLKHGGWMIALLYANASIQRLR